MKLFPIRGGIHPEYRKELSGEQAIEVLPLPSRLYIPLQQHIGVPPEVLVTEGELVKKGQVLARRQGQVSRPSTRPHLRARGRGDRGAGAPPLGPAATDHHHRTRRQG